MFTLLIGILIHVIIFNAFENQDRVIYSHWKFTMGATLARGLVQGNCKKINTQLWVFCDLINDPGDKSLSEPMMAWFIDAYMSHSAPMC